MEMLLAQGFIAATSMKLKAGSVQDVAAIQKA